MSTAVPAGEDLSVPADDGDEGVYLTLIEEAFVSSDPDTVCVRADWVGSSELFAVAGPGCEGIDSGNGGETPPEDDEEQIDGNMLTEWDLTTERTDGNTVNLPITGGVDVTIDWDDGNGPVQVNEDYPSNTYDSDGVYSIEIEGNFDHWGMNGVTTVEERNALTSLEPWLETAQEGLISVGYWDDTIGLKSAAFAFAYDLTDVPELIPNTLTNMTHMFWGAESFNDPSVSGWDVSNVAYMNETFRGASSFNQPVNNWTVENVVGMRSLFNNAHSFDQDISSWDVSKVQDMSWMFQSTSFNQDISGWETPSLRNMRRMFFEASDFNQDIGGWDVSSVDTMYGTFQDASSFNQDIGEWDVSSVSDMQRMFQDASSFDQDISDWDVSNADRMFTMFMNASSFNQDLSEWDFADEGGMDFIENTGLDSEISGTNWDYLPEEYRTYWINSEDE